MTQIRKTVYVYVPFKPMKLDNTLDEVVAQAGLKQLRIAETVKYPHDTVFLSGGCEAE